MRKLKSEWVNYLIFIQTNCCDLQSNNVVTQTDECDTCDLQCSEADL